MIRWSFDQRIEEIEAVAAHPGGHGFFSKFCLLMVSSGCEADDGKA